jgi:hypothetical protein
MKFKKGDRVRVVKEYSPWLPYALKGWTGTIVRLYAEKEYAISEEEYVISWDSGYNHGERIGNLIKEHMIELIEKKKKIIKPFPIVKFMENINARI